MHTMCACASLWSPYCMHQCGCHTWSQMLAVLPALVVWLPFYAAMGTWPAHAAQPHCACHHGLFLLQAAWLGYISCVHSHTVSPQLTGAHTVRDNLPTVCACTLLRLPLGAQGHQHVRRLRLPGRWHTSGVPRPPSTASPRAASTSADVLAVHLLPANTHLAPAPCRC